MELIYKNSLTYNGEQSQYTQTAEQVYITAKSCIDSNTEQIEEWEEGIKAKQVGWLLLVILLVVYDQYC